jgi:phage-related protein
MANFTWTPDFGATKTLKPNVTAIKYGDGYESRISTGMNNNPASWSLTFSIRDDSEADAIDSFLIDKNGETSFTWTPPDDDEAVFVCREWSRQKVKYNLNTISAKFDQVYEP